MSIFGNLLALPYMALFFAVWTLIMIARPFFVACLLMTMKRPIAALKKVRLTITAIQYLVLCNDKNWKVPTEDPASFFKNGCDCDKKTIIFVRHGESTWNDTFNRGDRSMAQFLINFIPGIIKSIAMEGFFFVTGQAQESWFYDSPLSKKGLRQAEGLASFLGESLDYKTPKEQELIKIMIGDSPSQLVSSNLRRAISTMAVGFQARMNKNLKDDSIVILSELQEISRNPDALTILTTKGSKLQCAWTDPPFLEHILIHRTDTALHQGNKPIDSNGFKRLQAFCDLVFSDHLKKDAFIAAGHSLWFRSFFQTYLPYSFEHISKKKKLINGGCVGLVLQRIKTSEGTFRYMIDPKSITVLYGGF